MRVFIRILLALALVAAWSARADAPKIGVVVMHGKGGGPGKHVADLASALARDGFLVANLDMPWSGRRDYDVDVTTAENEVTAALAEMRQKGATRVFVAGHSQGGVFALYYGGRHPVDGVIAIAPGGNVANATFREKLAEPVALARQMVADGKGQEKARFSDFEGGKGVYTVVAPAAAYLTWFDPDGAMNQTLAIKAIKPETPVLYIAPTGDYPGLQKVKQPMFDQLAKHPQTRLYEPDSNHLGAPTASIREIEDWTRAVAGQ
jgi:pimeloyl-ACP methyl ester carboxylesterase